MKNKSTMKKISAIWILFAIALLASCTASNTSNNNEINVRTGFAGLNLELLKNTPPQKVFEGDIFPFIVKIKNNGAYSIKNDKKAIISLSVEKDYTRNVQLLNEGKLEIAEGKSSSAYFTIPGRTQIDPKGGEEIISYNIQAGRIDPQSEFHNSIAIAAVCYPYETVLGATVCVDTDVTNLRPGKKVCNAQDLVFPTGQGAPVAITKIETRMLPFEISPGSASTNEIRPQFLIYVENKGPGLVIKEESVSDFCTKSSTDHGNYNIVYVDAYLSDKKLVCQLDKEPESQDLGHIKLKDKKDIIRCYQEEGVPRNYDPYLSPLKIEMRYGYTQSVSAAYFIMKPTN